jgi:uncharacterized membrane protein
MDRAAFLSRLKDGLAGLPDHAVADIVADYEAHFADGLAAGRTEDDVANALGDPGRLARELRAEAGLRQWEAKRDASSFAAALLALFGLAMVDFIFLLPLLLVLGVIVVILGIALLLVALAGCAYFVSAFFNVFDSPLEGLTHLLAGIGFVAGSVGASAAGAMLLGAILRVLTRYARLHYRLLRPTEAAA